MRGGLRAKILGGLLAVLGLALFTQYIQAIVVPLIPLLVVTIWLLGLAGLVFGRFRR